MIKFNPNSTKQLAILLFGGEIKDQEQVKIGVYKTGERKGQDKFKWEERFIKIKGLGLNPENEWKTDKGNISLDDKVLSIITKKKNHDAAQIASLILELRALQKEIGTYYEGFEELVHDWDNCIHGHLNHVSTDTGRLSSNKPNLQNLPK